MKSLCITNMGHTSEFPFGIYWWTLKNPKNQNFQNMKKKKKTQEGKKNWRYHHFTHVYQKPQSGTVHEIRSDTIFLSFRANLCPPLSLTPQKTKILKKKQKSIWRSGDIIIFNLCNKKHYQMMYAYSDMECDRQFFVILGHFLLFYPTIDLEN